MVLKIVGRTRLEFIEGRRLETLDEIGNPGKNHREPDTDRYPSHSVSF